MVSRAFGDFSLKFKNGRIPEMDKDWARDFCVTAEPELLTVPRPAKGFLAIMSDGLVENAADEGLKPVSVVAEAIRSSIATSESYETAARQVIANHVKESTANPAEYDGDDLTLVLVDVSLPAEATAVPIPAAQKGGLGVMTRKVRSRRPRTGKKKLPKSILI
jgi:serine/threonine protein phosphatase PrpC